MGTISTAVRNAMGDGFGARLEAGSAVSYPLMLVRNASAQTLVSIELAATDCIAAFSAGVGTLNAPNGEASWNGFAVTPVLNGAAADVVYVNRDSEIVYTGTVGTSGADLNLDTLTIDTAVDLEFSAAPTFTVPATT